MPNKMIAAHVRKISSMGALPPGKMSRNSTSKRDAFDGGRHGRTLMEVSWQFNMTATLLSAKIDAVDCRQR